MTKIVLCCSAGMSTSLFVQKAIDYAKNEGIEIEMEAISVTELDTYLKDHAVDLVAIAPQIRFQEEQVKAKTDKPVFAVDMRDYGLMNVSKVLPAMIKAAQSK
ncbi:MAG: PTS sugar transporter subunit IIB [Brevinema sp.]